ncbi:MAG TPA: Yip1 family protein [Roseiflexaceae bacterium]|nr:Yip1 family protein [Roseiflexaceae bacterium]
MFQQMLNGSIAVLTRPAVATFEEHERNNVGWALTYVGIGAVINAILGVIGASIRPATPPDPATMEGLEGSPLADIMTQAAQPPSLVGAVILGLFGALIGYLIYTGIVFLLGRAFGGTGQFGELAYDISLFYTPLTILTALLNVIAIGPLACLTGIAVLAASIYNLYLTYLGIQAGMNVPRDKAIITMVIIFVVSVILACIFVGIIFALIAAVAGASQTAP